MSPCELVVFDWDGTLMDSAARIVAAVQAGIEATGLPAREDGTIRGIIGLGLDEAVARLYPDATPEARGRLVRSYRKSFVRAAAEQPADLFPGVRETLARLEDAGYLLGVATGKSRSGLRRELAESGIGGHFVATRTADECGSKPHPRMLEELIDFCGVTRDTTLMVGDTLFDLEMAANARVDAVAVSWGVHEPESLEPHASGGLIHSFDELTRRLTGD